VRSEKEIRADAADERPFSNHTEYEIWADRYCWAPCVHDDPAVNKFCPVLGVALLGSWPKEWTRARHEFTTVEGKPGSYEVVDSCTEFEERRDPGDDDPPPPAPVPEVDGQLDLIDAYLDTAIAELTPEVARR
jgi:hypothetical protein